MKKDTIVVNKNIKALSLEPFCNAMKNTVTIILLSLCIIACKKHSDLLDANTEIVTYVSGNSDMLTTSIISHVEIIPLETNQESLMGDNLQLQIHNGEFYIADMGNAARIFRFDKYGNFLNTIGQRGRGPQEYLGLSDFSFDNNDHVSIFSDLNQAVYNYSQDGQFANTSNLETRFLRAVKAGEDKYWLYWGFASVNGEWRLAHVDRNGKISRKELPGKYNVFMMDESTLPVSYKHNDDTIYVRESINPNNVIYLITDNGIRQQYSFNFGKYNVPQEYFEKKSPMEAGEFLFSKDFTIIRKFMENENYALLEAQIQKMTDGPETLLIYGLKNKKTDNWHWFDIKKQDDVMAGSPQCLTAGNKLLCLVKPAAIKKHKDNPIITNPEIISGLNNSMNPVVMVCTLN